jgi:hypothetical protein
MVAPVTSFAIARQLLDVQREAGAMIIGVRSYADAAVRARSSLGVLYFCFLFFFYTTRNGWLFLTSAIKRFFIFSIYFFHLFFSSFQVSFWHRFKSGGVLFAPAELPI